MVTQRFSQRYECKYCLHAMPCNIKQMKFNKSILFSANESLSSHKFYLIVTLYILDKLQMHCEYQTIRINNRAILPGIIKEIKQRISFCVKLKKKNRKHFRFVTIHNIFNLEFDVHRND